MPTGWSLGNSETDVTDTCMESGYGAGAGSATGRLPAPTIPTWPAPGLPSCCRELILPDLGVVGSKGRCHTPAPDGPIRTWGVAPLLC